MLVELGIRGWSTTKGWLKTALGYLLYRSDFYKRRWQNRAVIVLFHRVDDRYPADVVLTLVLAVSAAWGSGNPATVSTYDEPDPKIVRLAIEAAVRGVVAGKDSAA